MFSRDLDFIRDSSERVFFGNFDRGESCTVVPCPWLLTPCSLRVSLAASLDNS